MNAVVLFFTTLFAIGYTPNADSNILAEIDGLTLEIATGEGLPNENREIQERVTFDLTLLFTYEDMDVLIEESPIYNDNVELIASYTNIGGSVTIVSHRIINMNMYDLYINNSVLSGFIYIEYTIYYRNITGEYQTRATYERSINRILEEQTEDMTLNCYNISFNISTGQSEAYDEGYADGYEDGHEDGYEEGFNAGEEYGEMIGYENGKNDGYNMGYNDGLANTDLVDSAISLVRGVFGALDTILNIEIIPGLKLSIILLVPIIFGVVSFFLNLWR